jgi:hypothetical protein
VGDRYATGTSVPPDRSRAEIEKILRRFGADQFAYGWELEVEQIQFRVAGRSVRLTLPVPAVDDPLFTQTPSGRARSAAQAEEAWKAELRRRWRSLALVIKAKLTAVQDGISTVEREFLADVILPDGRTIAEWAGPQLERFDDSRALLPGGHR